MTPLGLSILPCSVASQRHTTHSKQTAPLEGCSFAFHRDQPPQSCRQSFRRRPPVRVGARCDRVLRRSQAFPRRVAHAEIKRPAGCPHILVRGRPRICTMPLSWVARAVRHTWAPHLGAKRHPCPEKVARPLSRRRVCLEARWDAWKFSNTGDGAFRYRQK